MTIDGRVARRERNREAALEAVISLFQEGADDPGIEDVSERSGVSTRSVYRYFRHRQVLIEEAISLLGARLVGEVVMDGVGEGTLEIRIENFVARRMALYQSLAPLVRAARRARAWSVPDEAPSGQDGWASTQALLRRQFLEHFAPEFERLEGDEWASVVVATYLPFHFESFEYLLGGCGDDVDKLEHLLVGELRLHLQRLAA